MRKWGDYSDDCSNDDESEPPKKPREKSMLPYIESKVSNSTTSSSSITSTCTPVVTFTSFPTHEVGRMYITGPDDSGVKTITEYKKDPLTGKQICIVRKVREVIVRDRKPKAVLDRKKWEKFGQCKGLPRGPEPGVTEISKENIMAPTKVPAPEKSSVCPANTKLILPHAIGTLIPNQVAKCLPLHLSHRVQTPYPTFSQPKKDDAAKQIFIRNLTEDCTEQEISRLCRRFGPTQRIHIVRDTNHQSRGYAFVTFFEVAQVKEAIAGLHKSCFQSLILHVSEANGSFSMQDH